MGDPCCCLDMLSHIDEDSASLRAAAGWGWHVATHPLWPRLGWLADGWWEMMDGLSHLHSNQESRSEGWEWYIGASYLPNSGIFFCHFWHTVSTTFTVNAGNLLILKNNRNTALGKGNSLHSSQWALADTNRWLLRKQASQRCPGLTEMTAVCSTSCGAMPCALILRFSMLDQWVVKQTFHSNTLWCTITTKLEANASLSQWSNSRKTKKKSI